MINSVAAGGGAAGASADTATDSTLRVLGASATVMMAIASAVAGGVSLKGDRTSRELGLLKMQLTATDLQLVCSLLGQVQQLADRDLAGALQTIKQIIDNLKTAVSTATSPTSGSMMKIVNPPTSVTKTFAPVTVQLLVKDDMVRLGQRLTRLENELAKRPAALAAGQALQRVHLTLDRGALLAPTVSTASIASASILRR